MSTARAAAVVYAVDLPRLAAFYADLLGDDWEAVAGDGWVELGTPTFALVLHAVPPHVAATFEVLDPAQRREDTAVKLCLPVDDLDAARAAAAAHGGVVDPEDAEWVLDDVVHGRVVVCDGHDPEGNVIQLRLVLGG